VDVDSEALTLHDLSMSGLAVLTNGSGEWSDQVGADVPVRLRIGGTVLHEGRGRICRSEQSPFGTKIGLGLTSGYLDIPSIVARQEELSVKRVLDSELDPMTGLVSVEYRRVVADVLHLLRRYKSVLRKLLANGNGSADNPRMAEVLSLCEERMIPEWRALWHDANKAVMPIMGDSEVVGATKRFTELVVTPEFMAGPIWRRSYEKPLGYPGDYEVMNYVYGWKREGETPYGKLLHRMGLEVAECIGTRMTEMQQAIGKILAAAPSGEPARITSVGCGPAQEVANYLQLKSLPGGAEFTLIDQEYEALSDAYQEIYPETVRLAGAATVRCLQVSFVQLMKASEPFPRLPPQDLIYTVGLVDYLTPRRAQGLVAKLYRQLAPGGLLVVGNMRDTPTGNLWPMEFVCDWTLNYRSEAEMWALAEGLEPASARLEADRTGRVYLLRLRKP
jgi:SAM-dependent methyltransferase